MITPFISGYILIAYILIKVQEDLRKLCLESASILGGLCLESTLPESGFMGYNGRSCAWKALLPYNL